MTKDLLYLCFIRLHSMAFFWLLLSVHIQRHVSSYMDLKHLQRNRTRFSKNQSALIASMSTLIVGRSRSHIFTSMSHPNSLAFIYFSKLLFEGLLFLPKMASSSPYIGRSRRTHSPSTRRSWWSRRPGRTCITGVSLQMDTKV